MGACFMSNEGRRIVTVRELIAKLKDMPLDQEVWVQDQEWGLRPVHAMAEELDGMHWPWTEQRRKDWEHGDETEFKVVTL